MLLWQLRRNNSIGFEIITKNYEQKCTEDSWMLFSKEMHLQTNLGELRFCHHPIIEVLDTGHRTIKMEWQYVPR